MAFMLFLLSEVEYKVKTERKHYSPISFTKTKHHCLVDSDDQKSNCQGEDENVDEFHCLGKNSDNLALRRKGRNRQPDM
jgi:hypothetical protein